MTESISQAERAVERFLDDNYPCRCSDPQCPGNYYEAQELVRMMREILKIECAAKSSRE